MQDKRIPTPFRPGLQQKNAFYSLVKQINPCENLTNLANFRTRHISNTGTYALNIDAGGNE
jgi:hypothetical protein